MTSRSLAAAVCSVALITIAGCANTNTASSSDLNKQMQDRGPAKPNAQMQTVLDKLAALNPKPIENLSPQEARRQPAVPDAVKAILTERGMPTQMPGATAQDRTIPGPGGAIPVRIYTPDGNGPFPVAVFYHGGGWVIAGIDGYDSSARALAATGKHVVVSVGYRKAPENKFPAAVEDAYAGYEWARRNAASINGDPGRVSVIGESAGGNLALVTSMQARDRGFTPPDHQVLVYPVAGTDLSGQSVRTYATAKPLNSAMLTWFIGHYLSNPSSEGKDPRMSPILGDLSNLPPTTVIAAEIDPLTSGVVMLKEKLEAGGNNVRYRHYEGVTHEFFGVGPVVTESIDAINFAIAGLKMAK